MSGPGLGEPRILDPSRLTEARANSLTPILNSVLPPVKPHSQKVSLRSHPALPLPPPPVVTSL